MKSLPSKLVPISVTPRLGAWLSTTSTLNARCLARLRVHITHLVPLEQRRLHRQRTRLLGYHQRIRLQMWQASLLALSRL